VVENVKAFFRENETWLAKLLEAGKRAGELRFTVSPERAAEGLFASLEGALMAAWTFKDESRIAYASQYLVDALKT
jgi:TetR/AcrR family transcriptional repressor of nem operon